MSHARDLSRLGRTGAPVVANAQALRDLVDFSADPPEAVQTLGCLTAGDGGGGLWYWDAASVAADNLGTVLTPADAPIAGRWLRNWTGPTEAQWFGTVGDNATDDTAALQAYFTFISETDVYRANLYGTFLITSGLVLGDQDDIIATKCIDAACTLNAAAPIDTMLLLANCAKLQIDGKLTLFGEGSINNQSTYTCDKGIVVLKDSRHVVLDNLYLKYFKRYGLYVDDVSEAGILSFFECNKIDAEDIGSWPRNADTLETTISSTPVRSGASQGTAQRVTFDVAAIDPQIEAGDVAIIQDKPYHIYGVSGSTLTCFPWVPDTLGIGETINFIHGAAVCISGNDTNVTNFGQVRSVRCGAGFVFQHQANCTVNRQYSQSCGTGMRVGQDPGSYVGSIFLMNVGGENDAIGPILTTRASHRIFAHGNTGLVWTDTHRALATDNSTTRAYVTAQRVEAQMGIDDEGFCTRQWNTPRNQMQASAGGNVITNGPKSVAYLGDINSDVTIKYQSDNNEFFGYTGIRLIWVNTSMTSLDVNLDDDDVIDGWVIGEPGGSTGTVYTTTDGPEILDIVPKVDSKQWLVIKNVHTTP